MCKRHWEADHVDVCQRVNLVHYLYKVMVILFYKASYPAERYPKPIIQKDTLIESYRKIPDRKIPEEVVQKDTCIYP